MKKLSIVLIMLTTVLLCVSGINLWAESGFKIGPTLSFAGEDSAIYNASNMLAAKGGVFFSFPISGSISLQPEIYFAMKGGRYYSAYLRSTESARLNYIEIPLLLNVSLVDEKFEIYLGPYVGFLVGSPEIDEENDWTWIGNEVKDNDYGVSLGARFYLNRDVFLDLQFNNGLAKVVYDPEPGSDSFHKNKTLSLLVGFNF
jgi:hypothetical protein